MKLVPKQITLTLLVNSKAGSGTPAAVVQEKIAGAWGGFVTERPGSTSKYRTTRNKWLLAVKHPSTSKESMVSSRKHGSQDNSVHKRCSKR
jgi:hypothetical protein